MDSHGKVGAGFPRPTLPRPSRPRLRAPEHSQSCRIVLYKVLAASDYGRVTVHSRCDFGDMLQVPMASEGLAAPQAGLRRGSVETPAYAAFASLNFYSF